MTKTITAKEKIENAIARCIFMLEPCGIIMLRWSIIEENEAIETLATDGDNLYFNSEFVNKLDFKELCGVLLHEFMHCLFLHPTELNSILARNKNVKAWMIASEIVCNVEVEQLLYKGKYSSYFRMYGNPVSPFPIEKELFLNLFTGKPCYYTTEKYENETVLELYDRLIKLSKRNEKVCDLINDNGVSKTIEDVLKKVKDNTNTKIEQVEKLPIDLLPNNGEKLDHIERSIAVFQQMKKIMGDLPAGLSRFYTKLLTPEIDWRRLLKNLVDKVVQGAEDYFWDTPNFRHPFAEDIILPSPGEKEKPNIIIAIDTSGSITEKELTRFISEVSEILKQDGLDNVLVITTDVVVHEKVLVKDIKDIPKKINFKGGGGTNFKDIFEKVKNPELMVFFTDGYAVYPKEKPNYPVLWVLTKDHSIPPFGQCAFLKEEQ